MYTHAHIFPARARKVEVEEIVDINAVDQKAWPGDYVLEYEDGTKGLIRAADAHKCLLDETGDFVSPPAEPKEEGAEETAEEKDPVESAGSDKAAKATKTKASKADKA